jgi:hypothetical protein
MEAVKWLERLERGEISTIVRRDLNVELAPVEIRKRIAKFGDFSKLNNRINNENSETTHLSCVGLSLEISNAHKIDVFSGSSLHNDCSSSKTAGITISYPPCCIVFCNSSRGI